MTPEERQMLAGLFDRVASTASTPRDPQAEAFIADAVRAQPHAPYVLAQTVLVQQQALENASRRLAELEAQTKAAPQQETSFLGSIGRSLFGGGQPAPAAGAPPSRYAPDPGYQRQQPGLRAAAARLCAPAAAGRTLGRAAGGRALRPRLHAERADDRGRRRRRPVARPFARQPVRRPFRLWRRHRRGLGGGEVVNNYYESGPDAAGQHAEDVLQDQDQDQDMQQDADI